jgi:hypothetical protein
MNIFLITSNNRHLWIDLGLEKLNVKHLLGVDRMGPITPRCYTLTHSDFTGELFLSIGLEFDKETISGFYTRIMRDEVLAEWLREETGYSLNVYCHVSGGFVIGTAGMRFKIFRRELPLVLKAICKGDNDLFTANPNLENTPIFVHFKSNNKKYSKIENWGKPRDYR